MKMEKQFDRGATQFTVVAVEHAWQWVRALLGRHYANRSTFCVHKCLCYLQTFSDLFSYYVRPFRFNKCFKRMLVLDMSL